MNPERATYRLQFNRDFDFADAARIAPYLAGLGVSHVYASPVFKARAGSTHGYDVVDYNALNPELGGATAFRQLAGTLRQHGLGLILDFVPNHMGVAKADNAWWLDVLEWGHASPWADYFDLHWDESDPDLQNKVLLPFLGAPFEEVLAAGELTPRFDPAAGSFSIHYHEHRFPLAPRTCAELLRAAAAGSMHGPELRRLARAFERLKINADAPTSERNRVRRSKAVLQKRLADATSLHATLVRGASTLDGTAGKPDTFRALGRLLERQHWRLADWRLAATQGNYRRFFDVNELAAVRVEKRKVFEAMHKLVGHLLASGTIDGLRIDHIDGLYDPRRYLQRLRKLGGASFHLVVEKILEHGERLREGWPVEGTTGYDFMNAVTGLLVDARSEAALTHAYRDFTGRAVDFDELLFECKQQVIRQSFRGELAALAHELHTIARSHPRFRTLTLGALTDALATVTCLFPVYRSYVDVRGAVALDRAPIARAVTDAREHSGNTPQRVFECIESALTADLSPPGEAGRVRELHFAMRYQQFTAPVMAKGFEDTALYRYHRLLALNDVGGDPRRFGLSVADFHRANLERARRWPRAMLATATHDTKRGEDLRARLAALSTLPREWSRAVETWARIQRSHIRDDANAPDPNDTYLLYQTLIGAWPPELTGGQWDATVQADFTARIQAYMTKAMREAKQHTSWTEPDTAYEGAVADFIARILDPVSGRAFLEAFLPLQAKIAEVGVRNSLVQLTLKLTCPGVPDIYQGSELWDFNLVDPDNRRPVDFGRREALLRQVRKMDTMPPGPRTKQIRQWLANWHDGAIKFYVLYRLLKLRARYPELLAHESYRPIPVDGADPDHSIAFERVSGDTRVVVVAKLRDLDQPARFGAPGNPVRCVEVLTGMRGMASDTLPAALAASGLPVAVLVAGAP